MKREVEVETIIISRNGVVPEYKHLGPDIPLIRFINTDNEYHNIVFWAVNPFEQTRQRLDQELLVSPAKDAYISLHTYRHLKTNRFDYECSFGKHKHRNEKGSILFWNKKKDSLTRKQESNYLHKWYNIASPPIIRRGKK